MQGWFGWCCFLCVGFVFCGFLAYLEPRGVHNSIFWQFVAILPLKEEASNYKLKHKK